MKQGYLASQQENLAQLLFVNTEFELNKFEKILDEY
jgi:hypothetical protein